MRRVRKDRTDFPPCAPGTRSDYLFHPTHFEVLWERLQRMRAEWEAEDADRRKKRCQQILAEVAIEQEKQAREDQFEARRQELLRQQQKDQPVMNRLVENLLDELEGFRTRKLKVKLAEIQKEVRRDRLKAEREELLRRGAVRGMRGRRG